jgi:beta-ureidopropionase
MIDKKSTSRRNFIKQSSFGLGVGIVGVSMSSCSPAEPTESLKLQGVLSVATIDLKGLWSDSTRESRIKRVLERMWALSGLKPDILCLPELLNTNRLQEKLIVEEVAEDENISGPVTGQIAEFAKKNNCYVVCPIYTKDKGHYYNSSMLIDRDGQIAGIYHKIHPAETEILGDGVNGKGVTPGALTQPVIETDFGKVGMQIGSDAFWSDGWDSLKKQGANIILFSSDFPGGRMLNYYALKNNYYLVSSTSGDARVIDISGNDLDCTSEFVRYAWASINLDKVNVSCWPTNGKLPDLFKKYGDRLRIKVWGSTDVITIESRDPNLKVSNVLKEFEIPNYTDYLIHETEVQDKYRPELKFP